MSEENSSGCIPKVVSSWRTIISSLNIGHQIHPTEPIAPKDCEFIVIDKIHIRVIHVSPENQLINSEHYNSKRNSLSEEYWFTKWNKPLKIGNCNCSFRRSMRFSVISNQPPIQKSESKRGSKCSLDLPPTKIVNVETFVERLIQETFFEAFQEYYMSQRGNNKNNGAGTVNLAYESTEDDDVVVTLRRKFKSGNNQNSNKGSWKDWNFKAKRNSGGVEGSKSRCVHKTGQKKPLIYLLHGIGSTADVWWIVMNSLISKGYEVIAPDMLGHGYSSAPDKSSFYTFENLLLQALTIFDHYVGNDEKNKCILIGHAYGCSIATALYQHRAPQITQLILISGGGPTPLAAPVNENEISPFGCIHTLLRPLLLCGLKRSFFYSSRGKHFSPCDPDCGIPGHILQFIANGQNWPQGDAAFHRRILVPTLLVHGLQDKNVTLVQECEMERTVPRAFLELIPNAGHMAMLETPEHLTHMIICFLDWWS